MENKEIYQKDLHIYPAIFHYDDEPGIGVTFPDLPGCTTHGENEDDAYKKAQEALGLHLYEMEQSQISIPEPSALSKLKMENYLEEGETGAYILVFVQMRDVRKELNTRAVKKTLTIPKWLNDLAKEEKINFSEVLKEGLKKRLDRDRY
ncbi:MAG: type II toxin-antitoxin system HicB family antitoxin [Bacillaceae bacterium]|nr:type II toxin-antitoxin system HicB family antitoxin [Bacillaceae bacterium]